MLEAIEHGKHVVTANKALIALHGNEIFAAAQKQGVMVAFEAAVAGGIPIIKTVREGLTANRIEWLAGIINGTSNFILTEMRDKGVDFADVLKGHSAWAMPRPIRRLTSKASMRRTSSRFSRPSPSAFRCSSRRRTSRASPRSRAWTVQYAEELGYRLKLLGIARRTDGAVELRVHPTLIPERRLIANVEGAMNAVLVKGDAVGPTMFYGAGAGAEPTASAVVADLVDVVRTLTTDPNNRVPHLAFQPDALANLPILPIGDVETSYYLRLHALDRRRAGRRHAHPRGHADQHRGDPAEGAARRRRHGAGDHPHATRAGEKT